MDEKFLAPTLLTAHTTVSKSRALDETENKVKVRGYLFLNMNLVIV